MSVELSNIDIILLNSFSKKVNLLANITGTWIQVPEPKRKLQVNYRYGYKNPLAQNGMTILEVQKIDITKKNVAGIAYEAANTLLPGDAIGRGIFNAAGSSLMTYCKNKMAPPNKPTLEETQCLVTLAYDLKHTNGVKFIFHAVPPRWNEDEESIKKLVDTYLNVFSSAEKKSEFNQHIAIQLLGLGLGSGFPSCIACECAQIAVHKYLESKQNMESSAHSLSRITFITTASNQVAELTNYLENKFGKSNLAKDEEPTTVEPPKYTTYWQDTDMVFKPFSLLDQYKISEAIENQEETVFLGTNDEFEVHWKENWFKNETTNTKSNISIYFNESYANHSQVNPQSNIAEKPAVIIFGREDHCNKAVETLQTILEKKKCTETVLLASPISDDVVCEYEYLHNVAIEADKQMPHRYTISGSRLNVTNVLKKLNIETA